MDHGAGYAVRAHEDAAIILGITFIVAGMAGLGCSKPKEARKPVTEKPR